MKKLTEKNITQKIIISILIVLSFNFVVPTFSHADFGGVLLGPIIDLFTGLFDAVISGFQYFMYDGDVGLGSAAEGVVDTVVKLSLYDSFLVDKEEFKPEDYDMKVEDGEEADIIIDQEDLDHGWFGWKSYKIPIAKYTPEKIFSNQIPALDANFISPKPYDDPNMADKSITKALQSTIASWYVALRNLAVVGLLSVLIYVGIRMIISSAASDKAKYKQMLMDWVIALCLVFFLHYIMSFTLTLTEMLTENLSVANKINVTIKDSPDISFKTDLMGVVRMQVQYKNLGQRAVYMIMYICLTVYTVVFTWKYVKRAITMAFLTLMAPVVSLTYPIDKINDGKAQAFNAWLKEFIFNALLQPFHLIIYTVFLGSAINIAVKNPIFAILFLASIGPAEKLLKKFFGFDKSSTVGALDSASKMFGGAAAFKMLSNAVTKRAGKGGNSGGRKDNIRTQRNPELQASNGPRGYDGYTGASNGASGLTEFEDISSGNPIPDAPSMQEQLDTYDQGYGTNDWNAGERDAMARQANFGNENSLTDSDEERAQIMRDSGWTDDEISAYFGNSGNANPSGSTNNDNIRFADSGQAPEPVSASGSSMPMPNNTVPNYAMPSTAATAPHRETRGEKIKRGLKNKASTVVHDKLGNLQWYGQKGKQLAGFAGRAAVRTVTTGLGAAAGIGMGMAGDDLEDVLTLGAAGTALGATAGGNAALNGIGRVGSAVGSQISDVWHGSHEDAVLARQARRVASESSFRDNIQTNYQPNGRALQGSELNKAAQRAAEYYNQGITNNKAITKTMKLEDSINKELANDNSLSWSEEQKQQFAKEKATVAAKWAEKVSDAELRDSKKQAALQASFERGIQAKGLSKKDAEKNAKELIANIKQIKGID